MEPALTPLQASIRESLNNLGINVHFSHIISLSKRASSCDAAIEYYFCNSHLFEAPVAPDYNPNPTTINQAYDNGPIQPFPPVYQAPPPAQPTNQPMVPPFMNQPPAYLAPPPFANHAPPQQTNPPNVVEDKVLNALLAKGYQRHQIDNIRKNLDAQSRNDVDLIEVLILSDEPAQNQQQPAINIPPPLNYAFPPHLNFGSPIPPYAPNQPVQHQQYQDQYQQVKVQGSNPPPYQSPGQQYQQMPLNPAYDKQPPAYQQQPPVYQQMPGQYQHLPMSPAGGQYQQPPPYQQPPQEYQSPGKQEMKSPVPTSRPANINVPLNPVFKNPQMNARQPVSPNYNPHIQQQQQLQQQPEYLPQPPPQNVNGYQSLFPAPPQALQQQWYFPPPPAPLEPPKPVEPPKPPFPKELAGYENNDIVLTLLELGFVAKDILRVVKKVSSVEAAIAEINEEGYGLEERKFDCGICMCDDFTADEMVTLACAHRFCTGCFGHHCQSKIKEAEVGEDQLHCPGLDEKGKKCTTPISVFEIKANVSPEIFARYEQFITRSFCEEQKLRSCPKCNDWYIDIANVINDEKYWPKLTCGKCTHEFCGRCGQIPHKLQKEQDITCEDYAKWLEQNNNADQDFKKYLEAEKIFPCPKCQLPGMRESGCKFLYCRCKANFCALCGVQLKESQHYSHFKDVEGATGPYGNVCKGVVDTAGVDK